jgi:hypothetical protein
VEKCRAGQATDDDDLKHAHITCWILKATNAHRGHVICIAFPQQ